MADKSNHTFPFIADQLIMLLPCAVTACFYNGAAAAKLIAVCVAVGVICDTAGSLLLHKKIDPKDMSTLVTALSVAMMLPAGCGFRLAAIASFIAVAAGKLPFGEHTQAPFVPAAVGAAFACVVYPSEFFDYSAPAFASRITGASLTSMLQRGNSVNITTPGLLNILAGNCPGPAGTTCTFLFAACLVYLAIRRIDKFYIAFGFTAACAVSALLFPRVLSGAHVSLVMELGGGMLLFAATFLATYPNVGFTSAPRCLLYGLTGGVLCMLIRHFGTFEEGACFAVLIMNALSPLFERRNAADAPIPDDGGEADG